MPRCRQIVFLRNTRPDEIYTLSRGGPVLGLSRGGPILGPGPHIMSPAAECEENNLEDFSGRFPEKWSKPGPESGLDCLICAEFARPRFVLSTEKRHDNVAAMLFAVVHAPSRRSGFSVSDDIVRLSCYATDPLPSEEGTRQKEFRTFAAESLRPRP